MHSIKHLNDSTDPFLKFLELINTGCNTNLLVLNLAIVRPALIKKQRLVLSTLDLNNNLDNFYL